MAIRVIGAAIASAVLMFAWGFVFWGPVFNATARIHEALPADAELDLLAPMRAAEMPSGMYVYPGPLADMGDPEAVDAWNKKLADGPLFQLAYQRGGASPMEPATMAKGLAHNFLIALLAGMLLATATPALSGYSSRVGFVVVLTLVGIVWTNVGDVIWWFHSIRYCLGHMLYEGVAGLLMALVTAAIVRTPRDQRLTAVA